MLQLLLLDLLLALAAPWPVAGAGQQPRRLQAAKYDRALIFKLPDPVLTHSWPHFPQASRVIAASLLLHTRTDQQDPARLTSALVMGDLFLLLAGFTDGRDLKRVGVLYWNSRTRSASGLNGLLACTRQQHR